MIENSAIRARARKALGNNILCPLWLWALALFTIENIILGVMSTLLFGIGGLIAAGPLLVSARGEALKALRENRGVNPLAIGEGFNEADNIALGLMISLKVALWSILFVIPGVIKACAYSMAYYVKAEHPEYKWRECMEESERIMRGYKAKYFLLQLSFIGWDILGVLTYGIGSLWVTPYKEMSCAAFYEEIKYRNN